MVITMITSAVVFAVGAAVATWCVLHAVDQMTRELQAKLDEMEQGE